MLSSKSNSQDKTLNAWDKAVYLFRLTALHLERLKAPGDYSRIATDLRFYADMLKRFSHLELNKARVLELGYGQRPFRLFALQSTGADAYGIDLDVPIYRLNLPHLKSLYVQNGLIRTLKSVLRRLTFDVVEYKKFEQFLLHDLKRPLKIDLDRLRTGDLSDPEVWRKLGGTFDLIYSEDVFEHIPLIDLPAVIANMRSALSPDGIAIITPNVFTGITGGHDMGWYPHQVSDRSVARGPAWGHLTGETPPADTYLNRLGVADYRALFSKGFRVCDEHRLFDDLGREYLDAARRSALSSWQDEDLFSNNIRFVMKIDTAQA